MNKISFQLYLLLLLVISIIPIASNPSQSSTIKPTSVLGIDYDYIYCLASDEVVERHIHAPKLKDLLSKGMGSMGDFRVNYTGFTQEARDAFQFAVDIWDMFLDSDAEIVIDANFADLGSGVLGSAAPTSMFANFSDKVDQDIEFSVALAEKILGTTLNGGQADLSCSFSNTFNWSYDFTNPESIAAGQHDFVSVVLHELGHGLGFLSRYTFASTSRIGFIKGQSPVLTDIFSLLLEEGDGTNLILNYENASSQLGEALLGGDVFFNTHTVPRNPLPEIFAPNPWDGGSSLSHLDEQTFNSTDPLMTPSIGSREIIHDPEIALTMMNDMGWRSSFIAHRAENRELVGVPIPISANIYSDDGIGFDSLKVRVVYSQDSFRITNDTIPMTSPDQSSLFTASLPEQTSGSYQYAIIINDRVNSRLSSPLLAPRRYHDIRIGTDNEPPLIDHDPQLSYFLGDPFPIITAEVEDLFTGLDTVILEYKLGDGESMSFGIVGDAFTNFSRSLDLDDLRISEGNIISYRIIAKDKANIQNVATSPISGFHAMEVKGIPTAIEYYFNDFNSPTDDFSGTSYSVRTESGFDDGGLHSDHPYANAGTGNELEFITRLRVPIKVIEEGEITFNEVVLVEPAEPSNNFGDAEFWDYVIVEASKNNGNSWIPLLDGYDATGQAAWKSRYDNGVSGQNSSSSGDKDIMFKRTINLHQPALGINIGDEVQLRWRLFSDPFATGWGWVIDSLEIQKPQNTTPTIKIDEFDTEISIFPNPLVDDLLKINVTGDIRIKGFHIYDESGRLHISRKINLTKTDRFNVDISALESGLYFALFETEDVWVTKPFIKL